MPQNDHALLDVAGTSTVIHGAEGAEHCVQQCLQVVALVWYFVPRFKLIDRGVQAFNCSGTAALKGERQAQRTKADRGEIDVDDEFNKEALFIKSPATANCWNARAKFS